MRDVQELQALCKKYKCEYGAKKAVDAIRGTLVGSELIEFNNSFIGSVHNAIKIEPITEPPSVEGMSAMAKHIIDRYEKQVQAKVEKFDDAILVCFPRRSQDAMVIAKLDLEYILQNLQDIFDFRNTPIQVGKDKIVISYWTEVVPYMAN